MLEPLALLLPRFLVLLRLYSVVFLHLAEVQGVVGHDRLVCCLLLLLDRGQVVFADFGAGVVGVMGGDEVLVGGPNLCD